MVGREVSVRCRGPLLAPTHPSRATYGSGTSCASTAGSLGRFPLQTSAATTPRPVPVAYATYPVGPPQMKYGDASWTNRRYSYCDYYFRYRFRVYSENACVQTA